MPHHIYHRLEKNRKMKLDHLIQLFVKPLWFCLKLDSGLAAAFSLRLNKLVHIIFFVTE